MEPEVVAPTPLVMLGCADMFDTTSFATLSATALTYRPDALPSGSGYGGIAHEYTIAHLQGTTCTWTNDAPIVDDNGQSLDHSSFTVSLLPDAAAAFGNYKAIYGELAPYCYGADYGHAGCAWDGLTGDDVWVSVTFNGAATGVTDQQNTDAFTALMEGLRAGIDAAPSGEEWDPPASKALPEGCPGLLTAPILASVFGGSADQASLRAGPIGGTGLPFEAELIAGSDPCRWYTPATVSEYGADLQVLRGGVWAWEAARDAEPSIVDATPLTVEGLGDGDSAWLRDNVTGISTIDIILGGNWISTSILQEDLDALQADETALPRLAQAIVDGLG